MNRASLITEVNNYILSGGRRTTAANTRTLLTDVLNSIMIRDSDANQNNGYMAIDSSGRAVASFLAVATPLGLFLRDDGTWQAAGGGGGGESLAATLAIGNSVGAYDLTSPNTANFLRLQNAIINLYFQSGSTVAALSANVTSLRLDWDDGTDAGAVIIGANSTSVSHSLLVSLESNGANLTLEAGKSILYSNNGSAGAPRLTLDQSLSGLARLSSVNGSFEHDSTSMILVHTALIDISAPDINGTATGQIHWDYNDGAGLSGYLRLNDSISDFSYTAGSENGRLSLTGSQSKLSHTIKVALDSPLVDLTQGLMQGPTTFDQLSLNNEARLTYNLGQVNTGSRLIFSAGLYDSWTDGTASYLLQATSSNARWIWNNGSVQGQMQMQPGEFSFYHDSRLYFNAPAYGFIQLTASTVPYLNASKNLVSSAVTPTELGYVSGSTSNIQSQIDALVTGLTWKQAVRVATVAAGTLASSFENGDTVDGIVLVTGDRILIKDQATATENGIYTVNASGAPTRSLDMNAGSEFPSATVAISEGAVNADKQYVCTNDSPVTVGATNITFVLVGGTTYVGTSNRITVTGNVINISATYDALWQPIDSDLTAIAALTPSNDDFIQRKAGAWTNRSIAQVQSDLAVPVKNTSAELNTGSDDAKYTTALGLEGSKYLTQAGTKTSATTSGTNAVTATISPAITAYASQQRWFLKAGGTSTAAMTLNLNSLGAKKIYKSATIQCSANDWIVDNVYVVAYDTTLDGGSGGFLMSNAVLFPGTGSRMVEADAAGTPTATKAIVDAYVTDATLITALQTAGNWAGGGGSSAASYTSGSSGATGGYQGQYYIGAIATIAYLFLCKADQVWVRISLTDIAQLSEGGTAASVGTTVSGIIRMNAAGTAFENSTFLINQSVQTTSNVLFANLRSNGAFSIDATTPAQITANQNNYAVATTSNQRLSSDASRNITGITFSNSTGRFLFLTNVGSNDIVFTHEDAASTAANRFSFSTSTSLILKENRSMMLMYDSTISRWRDLNDGRIFSGTYTPTLTNTTNVAASTAYLCQYSRVGNLVTVSGKVDIDPTLSATSTVLGMSLPIASALTAEEDLGGVGFSKTIAGMGYAVFADATNDRATFQSVVSDLNNTSIYFTFSYQIK